MAYTLFIRGVNIHKSSNNVTSYRCWKSRTVGSLTEADFDVVVVVAVSVVGNNSRMANILQANFCRLKASHLLVVACFTLLMLDNATSTLCSNVYTHTDRYTYRYRYTYTL